MARPKRKITTDGMPDQITLAMLARNNGMFKSTLSVIVNSDDTFPQPVMVFGVTRIYNRDDIEEWAQRRVEKLCN